MRDEEIANAITKKLWIFTLVKSYREMLLDSFFTREEFFSYELHRFLRRLNANCPAHHVVDCSRSRNAVDGGGTALSSLQFSNKRIAEPWLKELRNDKQIGPGVLSIQSFDSLFAQNI